MVFKIYKLAIKNNLLAAVLLVGVFLFLPNIVQAATYYISTTDGNDISCNGLAMTPYATGASACPWKSLTKLNSVYSSLVSGDRLLFKKGDTFYGSLAISKSGTTLSSYGSGEKPIISGFETVTGWAETTPGSGIYRAPTNATSSLNMVTINEVNTPMGRYPKTGWLSFESFVGTTSITDNELTNTPNWTGAEVVIKKNNWTIDRSTISNHSGKTITYSGGSTYSPVLVGGQYSYFVQKSLSALTQTGDWYADGDNLYMYFGNNNPNNYVVKNSVIDKILVVNNINNTTIDGLEFEGSNAYGAYVTWSVNIKFNNCDFNNNGGIGIWANSSITIIVDNCNISNTNGMGIKMSANTSEITNNKISNTGVFAGMGDSGGSSFQGMNIRSTGGLIEANTVTNTGYIPISFANNNFKVRNNLVDGFCYLINDGAGIYTFDGKTPYTPQTGMEVYNNVVMNGEANGYYIDGYTNNTEWHNNTALNCKKYGMRINNILANNVHDNTFYDCDAGGISIGKLWYFSGYDLGNTLSNNIIAQGINTSFLIGYDGPNSTGMGSYAISNNKFIVESSLANLFKTQVVTPFANTYYTFPSWKIFTGQEASSSLITTNLSNILFEYNISSSPKTIPLNQPMIDAGGLKYIGSTTIAPFRSIVLIPDATTLATSSPVIPPSTYTLTYSINTNGTITGSTSQTVNQNESGAAVAAIANDGYHFVSWSDGSTANPRTDTNVTADKSVSATFAINTYDLVSSASTNGTISPLGTSSKDYGTSQTYTITPATGYHTASVLVDGISVGVTSSYTFSNIAATHTISATFAPDIINTYTLTINKTGTGSGTVTGGNTYNSGTVVTIAATAASGSTFNGWSGDCSAGGVVTMGANKTCVATFTLNAVPSGGGGGGGGGSSSGGGSSGGSGGTLHVLSNNNSTSTIITTATSTTGSLNTDNKNNNDGDNNTNSASPETTNPKLLEQMALEAKSFVAAEKKLVTKINNTLSGSLAGRLLLQVENHGEAWYINPTNKLKYYLGTPSLAFSIMRTLGQGISNADLEKIKIADANLNTNLDTDGDGLSDSFEDAIGSDKNNSDTDADSYNDKTELLNSYNTNGANKLTFDNTFTNNQQGKIFLQVENHGEAWYVNPITKLRYYLGRPADAYALMRYLSLGITNDNLRKIGVGEAE